MKLVPHYYNHLTRGDYRQEKLKKTVMAAMNRSAFNFERMFRGITVR